MSFLYTPESFNLVVHVVLLGFIHMHLYETVAIQFHVDSLAYNFTLENQLLQDGIACSCQSAALGMFLLILCKAFWSWLRQNSLLCKKDLLPTELFLQFAQQPDLDFSGNISVWNRNKNYKSFPTAIKFTFLGSCHIQLLKWP